MGLWQQLDDISLCTFRACLVARLPSEILHPPLFFLFGSLCRVSSPLPNSPRNASQWCPEEKLRSSFSTQPCSPHTKNSRVGPTRVVRLPPPAENVSHFPILSLSLPRTHTRLCSRRRVSLAAVRVWDLLVGLRATSAVDHTHLPRRRRLPASPSHSRVEQPPCAGRGRCGLLALPSTSTTSPLDCTPPPPSTTPPLAAAAGDSRPLPATPAWNGLLALERGRCLRPPGGVSSTSATSRRSPISLAVTPLAGGGASSRWRRC